MRFGRWEVQTLLDGTFALDGGSMFGVVPRVLWARSNPPDEKNRIALASRLLLLRGHGRIVLVDTGLGERWSDKERQIYSIRSHEGGVLEQLAARGIEPDDVTDVILTHLHFDHAAGTVRTGPGGLELAFPDAVHHLQQRHWDWAQSPTPKDRASFRLDDFGSLGSSDRLSLCDGEAEILPGVSTRVLDGHTRGMQAVVVDGDDDGRLLFGADLVPTRTHLRLPFVMAYDNEPLVTLAEKRSLLGEAAREGWVLVFEHDPDVAAVRLVSGDEGPAIAETLELSA